MEQLQALLKAFVYKDPMWNMWKAETNLDLGQSLRLKFNTQKVHSGSLVTTVSVCKVDSRFETYVMYQDFREHLAVNKVRVTEKACRNQHEGILANAAIIAGVLDRVRVQYFPQIDTEQLIAQIIAQKGQKNG